MGRADVCGGVRTTVPACLAHGSLDVTQLEIVAVNGRLGILEEEEQTGKKCFESEQKKHIQSTLFSSNVDTCWFLLRRQFRASAQMFIFVREALTGLYVKCTSLFHKECEWCGVYSEKKLDAAV